jgi:hypothetical protein
MERVHVVHPMVHILALVNTVWDSWILQMVRTFFLFQ